MEITAITTVKVCSYSINLHSFHVLDLLLQKWDENILQEDLLYSCKDYFSVFKVKPVSFWFCVSKLRENSDFSIGRIYGKS